MHQNDQHNQAWSGTNTTNIIWYIGQWNKHAEACTSILAV